MTIEYLVQLHRYLCLACQNPFPDEDICECRRARSKVAEMIAERVLRPRR
jgi:hypothetical protein